MEESSRRHRVCLTGPRPVTCALLTERWPSGRRRWTGISYTSPAYVGSNPTLSARFQTAACADTGPAEDDELRAGKRGTHQHERSFRPSTHRRLERQAARPAFCRMYVTPNLRASQISHGHGPAGDHFIHTQPALPADPTLIVVGVRPPGCAGWTVTAPLQRSGAARIGRCRPVEVLRSTSTRGSPC